MFQWGEFACGTPGDTTLHGSMASLTFDAVYKLGGKITLQGDFVSINCNFSMVKSGIYLQLSCAGIFFKILQPTIDPHKEGSRESPV